jgi:DNA integrity scanning protein DisA with diadenylate cyclase activity
MVNISVTRDFASGSISCAEQRIQVWISESEGCCAIATNGSLDKRVERLRVEKASKLALADLY